MTIQVNNFCSPFSCTQEREIAYVRSDSYVGKHDCSPKVHYRAVFVEGMFVGSEFTQQRGALPVARLRGVALPSGTSLGTGGDARMPQQNPYNSAIKSSARKQKSAHKAHWERKDTDELLVQHSTRKGSWTA